MLSEPDSVPIERSKGLVDAPYGAVPLVVYMAGTIGFGFILLTVLGVGLGAYLPIEQPRQTSQGIPLITVLSDMYYLEMLGYTIAVSASVVVSNIVVGLPASFLIASTEGIWKRFLIGIFAIPMLIGVTIKTIGWIVVLGDTGLVNQLLMAAGVVHEPLRIIYSTPAVFIALIQLTLPFAVFAILASMEKINRELISAAQVLGAGWWRILLRVVTPLSNEGVVSASILTLAICMTAFAIPLLIGSQGTPFFSVLIYNEFLQKFAWSIGAACALLLAVSTIAMIGVISRALQQGPRR